MASFYSVFKAELERLERAELAERGRVDEDNWRDQLDRLKTELGSWKAVSAELGTDTRTVQRWRNGYAPRGGGPRRQVSPSGFIPRIRQAVQDQLPKPGNRRTQVTRPDWSRMVITGTVKFADYTRTERMFVGRYFTRETNEAIADVYIARKPDRMGRAIDHALSVDYFGFDVHLIDTQEITF